jgi:hypothetical protein
MAADGLSDLLACVAAFGRSLDDTFEPTRFLAEFSARAQRLVPHDRVLIERREDGGQTCSVFAAYAVSGSVLGDSRHYTTAFTRGDRPAPAEFVFTEFFEDARKAAATGTTVTYPKFWGS